MSCTLLIYSSEKVVRNMNSKIVKIRRERGGRMFLSNPIM